MIFFGGLEPKEFIWLIVISYPKNIRGTIEEPLLRVGLGSPYFAEIENFLLKVL